LRSEVIREPVDGRDVTLTFDAELQRAAERILDDALSGADLADELDGEDSSAEAAPAASLPQGATLIAIDVATGDVLAAAAAPRFDLSLYSNFDKERWQSTLDDPRHPFYSRVTALTAPPGSVFKVLSAVAALESGAIDPETPVHCRGFLDRPDQFRCMIFRRHGHSHGDIRLSEALCQSCNVYFFEAARRMGPEPLRLWAERFGFGAPTGVDLPGEAGGQLPPMPIGGRRGPTSGNTLQLAIGQSSLLVSPLQVARMMAAVANGGSLVKPRFVRTDGHGSADTGIRLASYDEAMDEPPQRIADLSPRTLAILREGLLQVVADPRGTGKAARVKGVAIAGKTGTAETGGGRPDHAWFAGYAPAERPRIAFVVMLEHAGSGGKSAGPVAKRFVEALVDSGRIRRTATIAEAVSATP
jgi:penicillin-binding protein 2